VGLMFMVVLRMRVTTPSQYGFRWERKRCLLSGVSVGCTV